VVVKQIEFPDLTFSRLQDAVADVMVARDSVADIFLEEFERGVFSHVLRLRVKTLLDARERLDEAVLAYGEIYNHRSGK
jgi:hypothetical protein